MKAVVAAFNQEKALVGAFSVITNLRMELFEALVKEDSRARCWVVRNGTSWWEAEQEREGKEEEEQEVTLAEAGEEAGCSHRHEAAVTRLGNTWLMFGGRR